MLLGIPWEYHEKKQTQCQEKNEKNNQINQPRDTIDHTQTILLWIHYVKSYRSSLEKSTIPEKVKGKRGSGPPD